VSIPTNGRLAGIDYGTKRIGVAISDPSQMLASPLSNYDRGDAKADERFFSRLADEEALVGFVVGLPVHLSGDESEKSEESRKFGAWLTELTGLPVCFWDERFTSVQAEHLLGAAKMRKKQKKKRLDMLAAQILLASYLEGSRSEEPPAAL